MNEKEYEIRDPIHQTITFNEAERRVIDHPFYQRLRFIRQLGLKSLVYPGAVHDRFMHTMGAMHLAGKVFDALDAESDVFKRLSVETRNYLRHTLRLAALLHDIGHGPFSHASERLMPRFHTLKIPKAWYRTYDVKRQATHEDYSVLLIYTLSTPKEKVLAKAEAQDIASLVHKLVQPSASWMKRFASHREALAYHAFLERLISGELDVDRMDYLLRDAYFTGVPYGQYDLEWLLRTIGVVRQNGNPVLTLKEAGLKAFEDFLLARYHMFLQVYFHRTTAIFGYYVECSIQEHEIPLDISSDPYVYASMRDGSVVEAWFAAAKDPKNTWSRRLVMREPGRMLYCSERGNPKSEKRYQAMIRVLKQKKIPYIERGAQKTLLEHPVARSGDARILIARKFLDKIEYVPVEEVSTLLQKYNEHIDQVYLFVFREDYQRAIAALKKLQ